MATQKQIDVNRGNSPAPTRPKDALDSISRHEGRLEHSFHKATAAFALSALQRNAKAKPIYRRDAGPGPASPSQPNPEPAQL